MSTLTIINQLQKAYFKQKLIYLSLLFLCFLIILILVGFKASQINSGFSYIILGLSLVLIYFFFQKIKDALHFNPTRIIQHLNQTQPELEESCHLLLFPAENLNILEQLQVNRLAPRLAALDVKNSISVPLKNAWYTLFFSVLLAGIIYFIPLPKPYSTKEQSSVYLAYPELKSIQKLIPQIKNIAIKITPPSYLNIENTIISTPDFKIIAGSKISWEVETSAEIKQLSLILNDKQKLLLKKNNRKPNTYSVSYTPAKSFIYTINLKDQKSDLHAVELLPDLKPIIVIRKPKPNTEIAFGEPQVLNFEAELTDDFGLQRASLIATVAQGSGESVKFKELNYNLSLPSGKNLKSHTSSRIINLQKLGMTYGDELYFYVQAWDINKGYSRSETHFIQLEDTTVVTDANDLSLGVSVVPAYFRSQRQLIIDTEKLILDKKGITANIFQNRSNELGAEQKLLRLRYGKFLGEEAETNIGTKPGGEHHSGDGHDHGNTLKDTDAADLLDPFIHKHDTEEDATYFEPTIKVQLKAALAYMWEAELQLRLCKPAAALPFEYKALRQLKEVQQKSRAYVRKMGFTPPKIAESEKRLTGELTKIDPLQQINTKEKKLLYPHIRQSLVWLANLKSGKNSDKNQVQSLQLAGQELALVALNNPVQYLSSLRELRKLISEMQKGKVTCETCMQSVTAAFENILPKPKPSGIPKSNYSRNPLAEAYFNILK